MKYDRLIRYAVKGFCNRAPSSVDCFDDMYQEARFAFLEYIRRCDSLDDVNKFPYRDINHRMSLFVLQEQRFTFPKRTSGMKKYINSVPTCSSLESVGNEVETECIEDVNDRMFADGFMEMLSPDVRGMLTLAIKGLTKTEIAHRLGVSKFVVHRKISKAKDMYKAYVGEAVE